MFVSSARPAFSAAIIAVLIGMGGAGLGVLVLLSGCSCVGVRGSVCIGCCDW